MKKKLFAFLKRHHIPIDRNILTYGICVVIATILWFLNALNKDYTAEISYPVKYTDFPKGKHLISELPKHIILEVNAKGFALLGYKVSTSFLPITFNVNTYSKHRLENKNVLDYTINTSEIMDKISSQLSQDIKLQNIRPETIEFKFSRAVTKMVPILPNVNYTLKRQYILKNKFSVTPDSILVSGPATIMDTLKYIRTKPIRFKELSKKTSATTNLAEITELDFEDPDILIEADVERFTESKRTLPVKVRNLPDSLNIRLFPDNINVTFEIGLSNYDKISDTDFELVIDYNECKNTSFLNIVAEKMPPFIQNLTIVPQKVEYILEAKPTTAKEQ